MVVVVVSVAVVLLLLLFAFALLLAIALFVVIAITLAALAIALILECPPHCYRHCPLRCRSRCLPTTLVTIATTLPSLPSLLLATLITVAIALIVACNSHCCRRCPCFWSPDTLVAVATALATATIAIVVLATLVAIAITLFVAFAFTCPPPLFPSCRRSGGEGRTIPIQWAIQLWPLLPELPVSPALPALPVLLPPLPFPPLPPTQPARRGWSNNVRAFIAWQTACANATGLLLAFVERMSSSLLTNGGCGGGSGTITRSAMTHLAGMGRVNLVNFSTCPHRLARVVVLPVHPATGTTMTTTAGGWRGAERRRARVLLDPQFALPVCLQQRWPAGLTWAHRYWRGATSWQTGQQTLVAQWEGVVATRPGEVEDVLGTIAGGGGGCVGGSHAVASSWGKQQKQLPKPLPPPLPASQASLARDTMARLLLSSFQLLFPLLSLGGGREAAAPGLRLHFHASLQRVLGANQAAIGAARNWGGGEALPVERVVMTTKSTTLTTIMMKETSKGGEPKLL